MEPTRRLAHNLRSQSPAYGYTLTMWGAGHLLIHVYRMPDSLSVLAYVGGALVGFAVLSTAAFGDPPADVDDADSDTGVTALSLVHVTATAGNLLLILAVAHLLRAAGVRSTVAFAVAGAQSTVLYNASLLLEDRVSEAVASAFGA
ncbi:hypothetical protein C474_10701 [Halogeometricum pallidum JCM 14848]|uniref:Uncharacterized protein n=1 Tax=Halogeometricum pallidum JCM 14848 TaxID=1227487 RepID=M0D636_HALPD|nr:hypothetical protein [Halogeometricum pallidum]ELZ30925.1 hypothetical protein C474_10701 [Halogeometricum pallidum JCM 14848]